MKGFHSLVGKCPNPEPPKPYTPIGGYRVFGKDSRVRREEPRARANYGLYTNAMINDPTIRLRAQLAILKDVKKDYQGLTIDNIIQQLESRLKHLNSRHHD
jgi:hypothetical protein